MKHLFTLGLLGFVFLGGFCSFGETEKIKVIGSHIKRTQIEGPSPVIVIDKEQINISGHHSLSDVLRDLPVSISGGARENSYSDAAHVAAVGMRASAGNPLILLNGRRIVPISGGGGSAININNIPISAVERIELLTDVAGVSALYGADSLGGVINIVTKKDYKGIEWQVKGSLAQRKEGNSFTGIASFIDFWDWNRKDFSGKGDQLTLSASYGGEKDDISYFASSQLRMHTSLYSRDRSFGTLKDKTEFTVSSSPGNWSDDNGQTWHPAPGCPPDRIDENKCKLDYSIYPQLTPQILQGSIYLQAEKPFGEGLLKGQAIISSTRSHSIVSPAPDKLGKPNKPTDPNYLIPVTSVQQWIPQAKAPVTLLYRVVDEKNGGQREQVLWDHFIQTTTSFSRPVTNKIDFEGHFNAGINFYKQTGYNYFNKETLFTMLNSGQWKPLEPDKNKKGDISSASYNPTQDVFSTLVSVEPLLTGELTEIKNQPISFALGGFGAWNYYHDINDPITKAGKQWGGGVAADGGGYRFFGGVFTELSVLIMKKIEVQVAGRSDYYSDLGLSWQEIDIPLVRLPIPFSPKLALSYQIIDEVKLRASFGMGYQAPSLGDIYVDEIVDYPSSRDYFRCPEAGNYYETHKKASECSEGKAYKTYLRPNKNIKPTLSQAFNIGIVLEPVKEFSMSMDYYRNVAWNIASLISLTELTKLEKQIGTDNLKQATNGSYIHRYPSGEIEYVVSVPGNFSNDLNHGLDIKAHLELPIKKGWNMTVKNEHSHIMYAENQEFQSLPTKTQVPFYQWIQSIFKKAKNTKDTGPGARKNHFTHHGLPRWRNRLTLGFKNKDLGQTYNIVLHNIPSQLQTNAYRNKTVSELQKMKTSDNTDYLIDYYWQIDLQGQFDLTKNQQLTVGIRNVLGLDRPEGPVWERGMGYVNSSLYDIRGRTIDVGYIYKL